MTDTKELENRIGELESQVERMTKVLKAITDRAQEDERVRTAVVDALGMLDVHSKALVMIGNHVNKSLIDKMIFNFDHLSAKHRHL